MPEAEEGEKLVGNISPDGGEIVERTKFAHPRGSECLGRLRKGLLAYGALAAFFLAGCTSPLREDYRIPSPLLGVTARETLAPTPTITKSPYTTSVAEARTTREAKGPAIRATDTARTKDSLAEELKELPQNIVRSSAVIIVANKEKPDLGVGGTATFIEHVPRLNIYLVLTAAHLLKQREGKEPDVLIFRQPQWGIDFPVEKFSIATNPETDIALIAFIAPPLPTAIKVLGRENLCFGWVPEEGDELFGLTFPGDAPKHELFPIKFEPMTDEIASTFYKKNGKWLTTGLAGEGSSGAGVVDKKGKFIGIIPSSSYTGAVVRPLSEIDYLELWNKAIKDLLDRFVIKGEGANK